MTTRHIATLTDGTLTPAQIPASLATGTDLSDHAADTTGVHGIADSANVVLTNDARLSDVRTPTAHVISGVLHTGSLDHSALGSVTSGQHHAQDHKTRHESGGADELATMPTTGQKNALAGTSGTPGTGNEYVTTQDSRNADARTPTAHAASHNGGADAVTPAGIGAATSGHAHTHAATTGQTTDDHHAQNHASRHVSGGADVVKLDDLSAPDDNSDLNASTSVHGLLQKLPGGTSTFLRADGSFATPTASVTDPNPQSYSPGSFTVATEKYVIVARRLKLTGSQRATLQGTAALRLT
jgi:hypothetical protein